MRDDAAPAFGDLLRRYRTEAGLTQADLAEQAGISARAVSDLERGSGREPRLHTVSLLMRALGLTPDQQVRFRAAARPSIAASSPAPQWAPHQSLPIPATPLLGRDGEVTMLAARLASGQVRLLTLTGPGGVGKTSLALRIAIELRESFSDGVYLVSLAHLADPALVVTTIARGVGVAEAGVEPLRRRLIGWLQDRRLLLVLDNCEHLLEAMGLVADALAACPRLAVLATSRAPLRLSSEQECPVPPLALPASRERLSPTQLLSYPAISLFVARAHAIAPDRILSESDVPVIAEICRALDGLPLAIELAAARSRVLPPTPMLARLRHRLDLLIGGPRDAPARQRTLRDTLDWSYALLSPGEQALFARLAVFAGGTSFEAIEFVCTDAGGGPSDLLDAFEGLVRANLLQRHNDGAGADRFNMLQTIQEYAQERLAASGEARGVRGRHAAWFLRLAEQAEPALEVGPEQPAWLARLEIEHDNLRGALQWLLEARDAERFLRLVGALLHFWHAHAHFFEGRRWLDSALAQSQDASPSARMKVLRAAAALAMVQADESRAVALAEEYLALAHLQREPLQTMQALSILGMTAVQRGDSHQAARYLEECLAIAQAVGSSFDVARALYDLGLARNEAGISLEALTLIEQALPLFRETGETFWIMNAVGSLGYIALSEGRHWHARALLSEYLKMAVEFQDRANTAAALEGLAAVAMHEEAAEKAARLFALAEHLRQEIGGRLMSLRSRMLIERFISCTREGLGEAAWVAACKASRVMTMEEAVATALATDAESPIHER